MGLGDIEEEDGWGWGYRGGGVLVEGNQSYISFYCHTAHTGQRATAVENIVYPLLSLSKYPEQKSHGDFPGRVVK